MKVLVGGFEFDGRLYRCGPVADAFVELPVAPLPFSILEHAPQMARQK